MQKEVYDILPDRDGDIRFENGDLVIGSSDSYHIQNILQAAPGHYRQYPLIGANLKELIHGNFNSEIRKQLHLQLEMDGYAVNELYYQENNLVVDAERVVFDT